MRVCLGIPHTPWIPARVQSFERLEDQLGLPRVDVEHRVFAERAPNYIWSSMMWDWAANTDASHFLTLQDDAIVGSGRDPSPFWLYLRSILLTRPTDVIGLEAAHPGFSKLPSSVHWATTADMLIGVGYVVPVPLLREFLAWRGALRKGAIESITEDTLLGVWCLATGRKIWHPIPTIIDHDTEIASSYGNDHHSHRRPTVTWKDRPADAAWPLHGEDPPHFGRFYEATPRMARRWILGATEGEYQRWRAA